MARADISIRCALIVTAFLAALSWPVAALAEQQYVSLGTGPVSGIYYPTGQTICDVLNKEGSSAPLRCSIEATPGSVYNIESVRSGEEEFALVQSDVQFFASAGEGRWKGQPVKKLRAVMSLYPELLTLIARPDARIASAEDLAGKRVNIGAPGSGTRATWDVLKEALGITEKDLAESSEKKPEAAAGRMCANTLDASLLILGHPSKLVDSEIKSCRLTLVPIGGAKIDALVAAKPYYVKGVIQGADYGLPADTPTFGGLTTLVTSADVPDDIVYALTMAIMKNLDKLRQQPALAGLDPQKMATQSLTAPLHPGAERAFRELGLLK
ncbi:MAG: TAXI family TRAP transporter solute-binding subunit [Aestuariivirga sp.]|uniref:TAXI family TRAP transporter solute-binding subunit n=1 Tax=Aestuariivirga sp. TaxID=2650926 RepID=UPI00301AEB2F